VNTNHIPTMGARRPSNSSATDFLESVELRQRDLYFPAANNFAGIDFFGDLIEHANSTVETIDAPNLSRPDGATIEVGLQGLSAGAHGVSVALNGNMLGTITLADQANLAMSFPAPSIVSGVNTVTLASSADSDLSLLDHITLTYAHSYRADGDNLQFTAAGGAQISVEGFSNPNVRMVDITDATPAELSVGVASGRGGTLTAAATVPGSGTRTIYAFGADRIATPEAIALHKPAHLMPWVERADAIAIAPNAFIKALQPLIRLRRSQGLRVLPVDIADIYDNFSFGEKDPQAIRDFVTAAHSASHSPHYLILVGNATYDPRNFLGNNPNHDLVPTRLINTDHFQAASDGWFADFAGDGKSQMAIGRLPVENVDELTAMVSKILAYETSRAAGSHSYLLTADSEQGFVDASTSLIDLLPSRINATTLKRTDSNQAELLSDIASGPDVIDYIGHGNIDEWAGEWLSDSSANSLGNQNHPAVFLMMTCLNGYFIDPVLDSIAESLLLAKGGAVAVWASSGITVPSGQVEANEALVQLLSAPNPLPLGDAVRQAQNKSSDPDVRQTWNLLGDPEMKLR